MPVKITTNFSELDKYISNYQKNAEKAIKATLSDFRKRAPGWIAVEVVKEYNIKKNEIVPSKNSKRSAGTTNVHANTIETAAILYKGRMLTPVHFSVTPKASKGFKNGKTLVNAEHLNIKNGKNPVAAYARIPRKYNVKMTVKKGQQKQITGKHDTPVFMAPVAKGSTTQIPFQRVPDSSAIEAIRTVSLPQMVQNENVAEGIQKELNDKLAKRFEHHVERYMTK